ncbi:MAG: hypothetical protein M1819_000213 [Sarea resinae]|nr:MAG: hypothetical protein M1819_000213 [Sarea resinae]
MPIRNPFRKGGATNGVEPPQDERTRSPSRDRTEPGFQKTEVIGSRPSTASWDIKGQPNEIKLSVVNDSGVYLPPSPPEKKGFFHRSNSSYASSNHKSVLNENEPFSISRESFDSYRRSFDISARSPVLTPDYAAPRQSLDSRTNRLPRSAVHERHFERPQPTNEEDFEDVGLNDEAKPKRRGLFSRFGDSSDTATSESVRPSSSHHGFHFTSRKRGQSGQGAELGNMQSPGVSPSPEVKVDN